MKYSPRITNPLNFSSIYYGPDIICLDPVFNFKRIWKEKWLDWGISQRVYDEDVSQAAAPEEEKKVEEQVSYQMTYNFLGK